MHSDVAIASNDKKTPETVTYYKASSHSEQTGVGERRKRSDVRLCHVSLSHFSLHLIHFSEELTNYATNKTANYYANANNQCVKNVAAMFWMSVNEQTF